MSSVLIAEKNSEYESLAEGQKEASTVRYIQREKNLDLEEMTGRRELIEILELKSLYHEDLSNYYCVVWLKVHEVNFFRERTLLTGIQRNSIFDPLNY